MFFKPFSHQTFSSLSESCHPLQIFTCDLQKSIIFVKHPLLTQAECQQQKLSAVEITVPAVQSRTENLFLEQLEYWLEGVFLI